MKRFLLTTGLASIVALTGCVDLTVGSNAYASNHSKSLIAGDVAATLDERGDFRLSGLNVSIAGRVDGELSASAANFEARSFHAGSLDVTSANLSFSGVVERDVSISAADVAWRGDVGGDADVQAADLMFNGRIDGHFRASVADAELSGRFETVNISAADVVFSRSSLVNGDLYASAAEFDLQGQINGAADISARTVRISGDITQPMILNVDPGRGRMGPEDGLVEISGDIAGGYICARRVVIDGRVGGPLTVIADSEPDVQGSQADQIEFSSRNGQRCQRD